MGSLVQTQTAGNAAAGTTVGATFGSSVTAGNLIHVFILYRDAGEGTAHSVSDNLGNTYHLIENVNRATRRMAHYYAANIGGGACTVTLTTPNSNPFRSLAVVEISGLDTASPLDDYSSNVQETPGTGANAVVTGAATASGDGYLSACGVQVEDIGAGAPPNAGTGFTNDGTALPPVGSNVARLEHATVSAGSHQATFTSTFSGGGAHASMMAIFKDASGVSEPVGRSDETDSAQALSRSKAKSTGLSSESDSALALGRVKAKAAGLAAETDTALALDYSLARAVGLATESDTALGSARSKSKATGLASETDAALALAATHARAAGLATEADSATALSARKSRDTGIATETDTAFALSEADGAIKAPVERANETDTALALERQKARATGLSQETDSAHALAGTHVRSVGLASELETAFACSAIKVRPVGLGLETDTAFQRPVAGTITLPVGLCEEFDSALGLKATLRSEASGGFWYWAERHRIERERAKRRKREIEDETRDIEEAQAREIARLLRQQEERDARRAELDRLQQLADRYAAESLPLAPSAAFALTAAQQKRTENALLHLQREIAQMLEEEEAMVIALLMLDDQPVAGA